MGLSPLKAKPKVTNSSNAMTLPSQGCFSPYWM
jgi:hypothetical protein